ncbi:hypothetical protein EDD17DRAFT_1645212 [Pisolithus thermaeus]|nr:hypothetical protein EDD17DRAFT_1645212 [Pisolithus thermaeus]
MTNPNRARNGTVNGRNPPDGHNNIQSNEHFVPPYNHRVPPQGPRTNANGDRSPFYGQRPPPSRSPADRHASGYTAVRQISIDKSSPPSQPGNHHPLRGNAYGHDSVGYPPRGIFSPRGGRGASPPYNRGRGGGFRGRGRGGLYTSPLQPS